MKKINENLISQRAQNQKNASQNNLLALLEKTTSQNVSKRYSQNELFKAENVLKGYVNTLKEQACLSLDEEESENVSSMTPIRRQGTGGSSLELRSKKIKGILKKKEKEEMKKPLFRRMSYNDNNNRLLFLKNFKEESNENFNNSKIINNIENKNNEIVKTPIKSLNPLKPSLTVNQIQVEIKDPLRKRARFKSEKKKKEEAKNISIALKLKKPQKSYSKISLKKVDLPEVNTSSKYVRQKSSDEKNPLFSLLKTPERFEGEKEEKESIGKSSEDENLIQLSGLSNKNIIQLNEISKELKRTFIGDSVVIDNNKKYLLDEQVNIINYGSTLVNELDEKEKERYRILTRKGYVYDSFDDEENFDEKENTFYIEPDSSIVLILDFLVFIFSFYNLILIPLRLGYNEIYCFYGNFFNCWNILELLNDLVFFFDLGLSFFIAYYNFDEILKSELKSIVKHYLSSWFIIDLITAIPFQTLFTIFNKQCYVKGYLNAPLYQKNFFYLYTLLRLLKIFKVNSKNKFLDHLSNELTKFEQLNRWGGLIVGFLIFSFSLHIVACTFIFIGRNDYPSWIIVFHHDNKSFLQLYLIAIYYSITTLTTVGYGDLTCITPQEKIFGLIMEVVGIFAYSWALTAMSNYVKVLNEKTEELSKKCKILDEIKLTYTHFPDDLYDRVIRFLKYKQFNEKKDKNLIIDDLPLTLRNSLIYEMYKPIIHSFIFFKNFSNSDFIVRVILAFKPILAIKNDLLIKDGDLVEDIIFVKRGRLSLELPINLKPHRHKPSISKRNSIAQLQQSTLFFNNLVKESQIINATNFNLNNTLGRTRTSNARLSFLKTLTHNEDVEIEDNVQRFRILEIRKNEHFGDILMFLNQRSPLCLKVKSKKAELFYLNKADALDISTSYPQYWKKINKKSLFNMEQIKRLMNRVVRIFAGANGLFYTPINAFDKINSNVTQTLEISENEDSDLKSIPTITEESNNEGESDYDNNLHQNTISNNVSRTTTKENKSISEEEDTISSNFKNKKTKTISSFNKKKQNQNLNTIVEDEMFSDTENDDKASSSLTESGYEKKSYGKTSTYSTKKMDNMDRTEINSYKLSFDSDSREDNKNTKIGDLINKNNKETICGFCTPYKPEEINNEIYPEENFIITSTNGSHQNVINNIIKPVIDNISVCSTEISFSINSEYDNIDEMSDHKYSKNPFLRKRVKDFIKDEIGESSNPHLQSPIKFGKTGSHKNNNVNNYFKAPTMNKNLKMGKFEFTKTRTINNLLNNNPSFKGRLRRTSTEDQDKNNLKFDKLFEDEEKKKNNNKKDMLDVISHNIEKNVMNLNNPDQFYSEFFLKFMDKKKSKLTENDPLNKEMKKEEKDFIHKMEKRGTIRGYDTLKSFSTIRSKI